MTSRRAQGNTYNIYNKLLSNRKLYIVVLILLVLFHSFNTCLTAGFMISSPWSQPLSPLPPLSPFLAPLCPDTIIFSFLFFHIDNDVEHHVSRSPFPQKKACVVFCVGLSWPCSCRMAGSRRTTTTSSSSSCSSSTHSSNNFAAWCRWRWRCVSRGTWNARWRAGDLAVKRRRHSWWCWWGSSC